MKILICGGKREADYVVRSFKEAGNHLVIMNDDEKTAKKLSELNGTDVLLVNPTKIYSFEIADVSNFDLVISLMERDCDNFVVCQLAKKVFHIRKAICTVNNPNSVSLFEKMGIDSPISAPYLLTERIKGESDIESLTKTMSLENQKIVITELKVKKGFYCADKDLRTLQLPQTGSLTCVFRDPQVLIPRGDTKIQVGDTVVMASSPDDQESLVSFLKEGK